MARSTTGAVSRNSSLSPLCIRRPHGRLTQCRADGSRSIFVQPSSVSTDQSVMTARTFLASAWPRFSTWARNHTERSSRTVIDRIAHPRLFRLDGEIERRVVPQTTPYERPGCHGKRHP